MPTYNPDQSGIKTDQIGRRINAIDQKSSNTMVQMVLARPAVMSVTESEIVTSECFWRINQRVSQIIVPEVYMRAHEQAVTDRKNICSSKILINPVR